MGLITLAAIPVQNKRNKLLELTPLLKRVSFRFHFNQIFETELPSLRLSVGSVANTKSRWI